MDNSISSDLIRGHIDTIILRTLVDGDKHALDICKEIEQKSDSQYELKQATLYSSLKRLENLKYIKAYWGECDGGRRRYFHLTDEGKQYVEKNLSDWQFSRAIIDKLITNNGDLPPISFDHSASGCLNGKSSEVAEKTVLQEKPDFKSPILQEKPLDDSQKEQTFVRQESAQEKQVDVIYRPIVIERPAKSFEEQQSIIDKKLQEMAERNAPVAATTTESVDTTQQFVDSKPEIVNSDAYRILFDKHTDYEYKPQKQEDETVLAQKQEVIQQKPIEIKPKQEEKQEIFFEKDEKTLEQEKNYKQILGGVVASSAVKTAKIQEKNVEIEPDSVEIKQEIVDSKPEIVEEIEIPMQAEVFVPKTTSGKMDFSDIFDKAAFEGYKVRISKPNQTVFKNKIFINKLNFVSGLVSFLLIMVQILALTFGYKTVLNLSTAYYLGAIVIFAIFPITLAVLFFKNPLKTVNSKKHVKNKMLSALIITFDILLVIIAIVVLSDLDLSIARTLMLALIFPIILFVNVLIYYLIKFTLLATNKFYTEK